MKIVGLTVRVLRALTASALLVPILGGCGAKDESTLATGKSSPMTGEIPTTVKSNAANKGTSSGGSGMAPSGASPMNGGASGGASPMN